MIVITINCQNEIFSLDWYRRDGSIGIEYTHDSDYTVIAFAVDDEYLPVDQPLMHNLPIIALSKLHQLYEPSEIELFVAVSSGKLNRVRRDLYTRFKQMDYTFATYISSKCFVWSNVVVGENCFILEHNTLQPFVTIGNNVTLWSGNHIGHRSDCRQLLYLVTCAFWFLHNW